MINLIGGLVFSYVFLVSSSEFQVVGQSSWFENNELTVSYLLENTSSKTELISTQVLIKSVGYLSNSCLTGHGVPLLYETYCPSSTKDGSQVETADTCWESISVSFKYKSVVYIVRKSISFYVDPGDQVVLIVNFKHNHFLQGKYHPLFGKRLISLWVNGWCGAYNHYSSPDNFIRSKIFNRSQFPADVSSTTYTTDGSPSLWLFSHAPDILSYRVDNIQVRYGSLVRVSFFYLVAEGSISKPVVDIQQFKSGPGSSWSQAPELDQSFVLLSKKKSQQWERFDRIIKIGNSTTDMTVRFRLMSGDFNLVPGEIWISQLVVSELED